MEDRLGIPFKWVSNSAYFENETDVLVYDSKPLDGFMNIFSEGLLNEDFIRPELPQINEHYFPSPDGFSYAFDLFSAVFFIVTRYEEYLVDDVDQYGRFKAENSIQTKLNLLQTPVVDTWIFEFGSMLEKRFNVSVSKPNYKFTPSIDVDVAYAYLGRPFWLTLAGYFRDLKQGDFSAVKRRFRVNTGLDKDGYDTYEYFRDLCLEHQVKPYFFFQVGERGFYDKNLYPYHPLMRELIADTAQWAYVGLHPSFASNTNGTLLRTEKRNLEHLIGAEIFASRQHFLKFALPDTYLELGKNGIQQEFSMGYSSHIGFRAGTCHAFPFFDLTTNTSTSLIIRPFAVMDGTLKDSMKLDVVGAKASVTKLIETTRNNHGEFIFIWHNSSLSELGGWKAWDEVLVHIFKTASK